MPRTRVRVFLHIRRRVGRCHTRERTRTFAASVPPGLPLTLIGVALFSSKKAHRFLILDILWAIYDVEHFGLRTNSLTGTDVLGDLFKVAPESGRLWEVKRGPGAPELSVRNV